MKTKKRTGRICRGWGETRAGWTGTCNRVSRTDIPPGWEWSLDVQWEDEARAVAGPGTGSEPPTHKLTPRAKLYVETVGLIGIGVFGLTLIGFGIALAYQAIGLAGLALFVLPIALACHLFRLYARTVEDVRLANRELRETNTRLNVMSQVSGSLVGSLHLDDTLDRIVAAIRLMGFPAGFVAGPLSPASAHLSNWRATHPALAQWTLTDRDRALQTALAQWVTMLGQQEWFLAGEIHVLPVAELGLTATPIPEEASRPDAFSLLVLVPLVVQGIPWGVIGFGTRRPPSEMTLHELAIFRSLGQGALEMVLTHAQVERDAVVDARTGLYNHRHFQEALQRELQAVVQRNGLLSFLMIDIDRFKEFNDLYGHVAGDQALAVVAQILRSNIRKADIACRYGGDEMCVLMPDTDRQTATLVATRIETAVRAYRFRVRRHNGSDDSMQEASLRVSVGVASFPEAASARAGLVEQADRACYAAKASGGGVAAPSEPADSHPSPARLSIVK